MSAVYPPCVLRLVADLSEAFDRVLDQHLHLAESADLEDWAPFSLHLGSHGEFLAEFLEEGPSFDPPREGPLK